MTRSEHRLNSVGKRFLGGASFTLRRGGGLILTKGQRAKRAGVIEQRHSNSNFREVKLYIVCDMTKLYFDIIESGAKRR